MGRAAAGWCQERAARRHGECLQVHGIATDAMQAGQAGGQKPREAAPAAGSRQERRRRAAAGGGRRRAAAHLGAQRGGELVPPGDLGLLPACVERAAAARASGRGVWRQPRWTGPPRCGFRRQTVLQEATTLTWGLAAGDAVRGGAQGGGHGGGAWWRWCAGCVECCCRWQALLDCG